MFDFYDTSNFTLSDCDRLMDTIGIINGQVMIQGFSGNVLTRIPLLLPTSQQSVLDIWNADENLHATFATDWKRLQLCAVRDIHLMGFYKIREKKILYFRAKPGKITEKRKFIWLSEDAADFWDKPVSVADPYNKDADEQESWPDLPEGPTGFLRASAGSVLKTRLYSSDDLDTALHMSDLDPFYWEDFEKLYRKIHGALNDHVSHNTNRLLNKHLLFNDEICFLGTRKIADTERIVNTKLEVTETDAHSLAIFDLYLDKKLPQTTMDSDNSHDESEKSSDEEIATTSKKTRRKLVYTSSESEPDNGMSDSERPTLFNDDEESDCESAGIMPMIPDEKFDNPLNSSANDRIASAKTRHLLQNESTDDNLKEGSEEIGAKTETPDEEVDQEMTLHSHKPTNTEPSISQHSNIIPEPIQVQRTEFLIAKLTERIDFLEEKVLCMQRKLCEKKTLKSEQ